MKKVEWPGIATAVGIVFILTIIFAGAEPDFKLKDWQPLMAGLIALGGGTLAYRGAMAKIYADREKDQVELDRKKVGLYLRLRFAVGRMIEEAKRHKLTMNVPYRGGNIRYNIRIAELRFQGFEEFEEAWKHLDLLPRTVSLNLDQIRIVLAKDDAFLEKFPDEIVRDVTFVYSGSALYPCVFANDYLEAAGIAVAEELDREISRLS